MNDDTYSFQPFAHYLQGRKKVQINVSLTFKIISYNASSTVMECTDVSYGPKHYYQVLIVCFTMLEQLQQNLHASIFAECVGVSGMT